jgi:SsrA-binding protein
MEHRPWKTIFAENKKAFFDYEIIEEYEAGVKLFWEEVKSVRSGNINLKGSYILINKSVATMIGAHIGELKGGMRLLEPKRERDILLSKHEIQKLQLKVKEMGATLVPLSFYAKWNLIKVRVALVKGKKTWQKKESIKARDLDREMAKKFRL